MQSHTGVDIQWVGPPLPCPRQVASASLPSFFPLKPDRWECQAQKDQQHCTPANGAGSTHLLSVYKLRLLLSESRLHPLLMCFLLHVDVQRMEILGNATAVFCPLHIIWSHITQTRQWRLSCFTPVLEFPLLPIKQLLWADENSV